MLLGIVIGLFLAIGIAFYRRPLAIGYSIQRQLLQLFGFKPQKFQSPYGSLHYFEGGKGELLVFVHGFMVHAGNWLRVAPPFLKSHRVIILDLPGHGESELCSPYNLETISAIIEAFLLDISKEQPFTLVGNSMGGGISFKFALEHPEKVINLVVVNSAALDWKLDRNLLLPQNTKDALRKMQAIVDKKMWLPNFVLRDLVRENKPHLIQLYDEAVSSDRYHLDEDLKNLKVTPYLFWGEKDGIFPLAYAEKLKTILPDYTYVPFPNDAHVPQNTGHKAFIEKLYQVLTTKKEGAIQPYR